MKDVDDDALMARVTARDQAAFGCLVARHVDGIHRYLTRLMRSGADADELTQETFLRLWQQASSYRSGSARPGTWLHRIAHNLAVDRLRRQRDVEPPPEHVGLADPAADPERLAASAQTGKRLEAALAALPATQRAALLLCQVQGFSARDTGLILGVSIRSVESLLARARRSLRRALAEGEDRDDE